MTTTYIVRDAEGKIDDRQFRTREMAEHHAAVMSLRDATQYHAYHGHYRFSVVVAA